MGGGRNSPWVLSLDAALMLAEADVSQCQVLAMASSHLLLQEQQQISKVPRDKFNQGGKRAILRKLLHTEERH